VDGWGESIEKSLDSRGEGENGARNKQKKKKKKTQPPRSTLHHPLATTTTEEPDPLHHFSTAARTHPIHVAFD